MKDQELIESVRDVFLVTGMCVGLLGIMSCAETEYEKAILANRIARVRGEFESMLARFEANSK